MSVFLLTNVITMTQQVTHKRTYFICQVLNVKTVTRTDPVDQRRWSTVCVSSSSQQQLLANQLSHPPSVGTLTHTLFFCCGIDRKLLSMHVL